MKRVLLIAIVVVAMTVVGCVDRTQAAKIKALQEQTESLAKENAALRDELEQSLSQRPEVAFNKLSEELPTLNRLLSETYLNSDMSGLCWGASKTLYETWYRWQEVDKMYPRLVQVRNMLLQIYRADLKTPDPAYAENKTGEEDPEKVKIASWLAKFSRDSIPYPPDGTGLKEALGLR